MVDHSTQQLLSGLRELASYPVQVEGTLGPAEGGRPPTDGTAVVEGALRRILGSRTRVDDVSGFRTALSRSFAQETVDGSRRSVLRLPGGIVEGAEDLPSVQASLLTRASDVVDRVDRLLPVLRPLRVDADAEDIAATVGVVRDAVTRLRDEFGRADGPRVGLVEQHWRILLGEAAGSDRIPDPDLVGGALGALRGLLGSGVNSTDEERQVTQFRLVVDYVAGLFVGWRAAAGSFGVGTPGGASLGGTVRRLRLQFSTVQEAVERVRSALESVHVGEAEQRIHFLTPSDRPDERLSIADLLDWASTVVGPDADAMLRDGGRIAITSYLLPNAERVSQLLDEVATIEQPGGLGSGRVRAAMHELATQFTGVAEEMAVAVPPPAPTAQRLRLVPPVVGEVFDDATETLEDSGFVVEPVERFGSQAPGTVEETDPAAGELATAGSTVVVVVTEWPVVPDLVGTPLPEARRALEELRLIVGHTEFVRSAVVAAGAVVESDPPAATPLATGNGVGLEVSTGSGYDETSDLLCVLAGIAGDVFRDSAAAWEALRRVASGEDGACSPAVGRAERGIQDLVNLLVQVWEDAEPDSVVGGLRARSSRASGLQSGATEHRPPIWSPPDPSPSDYDVTSPDPVESSVGSGDPGHAEPSVDTAASGGSGAGVMSGPDQVDSEGSIVDRPAKEIDAGLRSGELDPAVVIAQEQAGKARTSVLRAAEQKLARAGDKASEVQE